MSARQTCGARRPSAPARAEEAPAAVAAPPTRSTTDRGPRRPSAPAAAAAAAAAAQQRAARRGGCSRAAVAAPRRAARRRSSSVELSPAPCSSTRPDGRSGRPRFEAPLRARVDAGARAHGRARRALRELGAAEVELRGAARGRRARGRDRDRADADRGRGRRHAAGSRRQPPSRPRATTATSSPRALERLEQRRISSARSTRSRRRSTRPRRSGSRSSTTQREDLEQSLKELAELRDELAETVERRFAETFAAVAATLRGGRGDALPRRRGTAAPRRARGRGRRARGGGRAAARRQADHAASLLSGGEKALGAISFLFALFLAKPCPFYLLDEVEAALDDANIGRFVELLRRYADRAQFVVITHQKRTMEAADVLYGVTMGGDGVSQIVSRRLPREDAAALALVDSAGWPGRCGAWISRAAIRRSRHLVRVDVLEPDQQEGGRRLEVRRQPGSGRARRARPSSSRRPVHIAPAKAFGGLDSSGVRERGLRQESSSPRSQRAQHDWRLAPRGPCAAANVPRRWREAGQSCWGTQRGREETAERARLLRAPARLAGESRRALTEQLAAAAFDPGDDEAWERLEEALIHGDVGVRATAELVRRLEARGELGDLGEALAEEIAALLGEPPTLDLAGERRP